MQMPVKTIIDRKKNIRFGFTLSCFNTGIQQNLSIAGAVVKTMFPNQYLCPMRF